MNNKQLRSIGGARPPAAGRGRQKGELNRTTIAVKEALTLAFEGVGGVAALTEWAMANQTEFYRLYVKLLPREMSLEMDYNGLVRRTLLSLADD